MECNHVNERLTDWLSHQLSDVDRADLESHLAQCPACQQAFDHNRQLWQLMGKLPVPNPSDAMYGNFYAMLDTFKAEVTAKSNQPLREFWQRFRQWLTPQLAFQLTYSICLITFGVLAGYWYHSHQNRTVAYKQQIETLSEQVQEMRRMVMLSLLENPSATERLRAVSYTKDIQQVDEKVVEALLTTLDNDPNVNVRLVTLEALAEMGHAPKVREGLIHSLTRQDSPLVQVALADVMVKLQEKRSIKQLRTLLHQEGINDLVKTKIEQTIRDLS